MSVFLKNVNTRIKLLSPRVRFYDLLHHIPSRPLMLQLHEDSEELLKHRHKPEQFQMARQI